MGRNILNVTRCLGRLCCLVFTVLLLNKAVSAQTHYDNYSDLVKAVELTESPTDGLALLKQQEAHIDKWEAAQQAKFYMLIGRYYELNLAIDLAEKSYSQSIDVLEKVPLNKDLIVSYLERSYMKYLQTNVTADYCPDRKKAKELAEQLGEPEIIVRALSQYAFCFNNSDNFAQGIKILQQALEMAQDNNISLNRQAIIYNATGILYRNNEIHDKAYDNTLKAYTAWKENGDVEGQFNMLHVLVGEAIALENWHLAGSHLEDMFALAETNPVQPDFEFFAYFNQGRLAYFQGDMLAALDALTKATSLKNTTEENYFVDLSYAFLALSQAKLGNLEQAYNYIASISVQSSLPEQIKILLEGIDALQQANSNVIVDTYFKLTDLQRARMLQFVNNQSMLDSNKHESNIVVFEKQLLEQKLAISELKLSAAQDKERINQLTKLAISLGAAILLMAIFWLARSQRKFKMLAQTDPLTGGANRRHTFARGRELLEYARKNKQHFSVILLDIDYFKKINDKHGHAAGDSAIRHVTKVAQTALRDDDLFGRIGGEEFLILLSKTGPSKTLSIAERIRREIEINPFMLNQQNLQLTISVGCNSVAPESAKNDLSLDELINQADEAMYQAKQNGRNQVRVFKQY